MKKTRERWGWSLAGAALLLAIALRIYAFPKIADDFIYFFDGWIAVVREHGARAWNPETYANYSPPNLYAIWASLQFERLLGLEESNLTVLKMTTLSGDFLLGAGAFALVRALGRSRLAAAAGTLAIWLTPTLFLNGAWWGQFDAWYAAFLLFSVAALVRKNVPISVFFFTVAFTWKAQALFLLPALGPQWVLSLFGTGRRPGRDAARSIGAVLFAYGLAAFPAWTQGLPWTGLLDIYVGQKEAFHKLSMNAPNIWSLFPDFDYERGVFRGIAIGILASFTIAAGIFARRRRIGNASEALDWILLSAIAIPFLLPKMHERYFFLAEALATVLLVVRRDRTSLFVWALLETVTIRTYGTYLFQWARPDFFVLVLGIGFAANTVLARFIKLKN